MSLVALLRRLLSRTTSPAIAHTLVCGTTRSGKSEAELSRLLPLAEKGECAIVLLDPPGTLAAKFLLHLEHRGLLSRVLYDRLADTDKVPGYEWLVASRRLDPLQREAENDERVREFASVLLRRRGIQDPAATPLIEEWHLAALALYLHQDSPVPLPWLADAFDLRSGNRAHLLAHCTVPGLVHKFQEYAALGPAARRTEAGPAQRILRAVLTSPAFRARSGGATFDIDRFLDGRGILILDGSSRGNLSRDAAGVMIGAVILRVIRHCRTGVKSRVVLVLDEAVNGGLIGLHESQALAEAAKWGLEVHILVQNPLNFPSPEIQRNVLQNCWRHEWFRQGSPEAARLAAEDVAIPLLDPLRVHHREYRVRTVVTGFRKVRTGNGTALWPRRKEVKEVQDRYTTLSDQILLMQKELMLLKPGYRFVRDDAVTATPEYVPMLSNPSAQPGRPRGSGVELPASGPEEDKSKVVLRTLKRGATYYAPVGVPAGPSTNGRSQGAARRLVKDVAS